MCVQVQPWEIVNHQRLEGPQGSPGADSSNPPPHTTDIFIPRFLKLPRAEVVGPNILFMQI